MPVADAVEVYLDRGWRIIPLHPRSKRPIDQGWERINRDRTELVTLFRGQPDLNPGLIITEEKLDLDLDWPEAVQAAAAFLPRTPARFGRASKPESHWLYRLSTPMRYHKFNDPTNGVQKKTILELRTGGGHQTALPPSVHESGETVRWVQGGPDRWELPEITPETAEKSACRLAACSLIGRYWPGPGAHHDPTLYLSGALSQLGWDEADVSIFVETVCHIAGDTGEMEDRLSTIRTTFERMAQGQQIAGFPRLTEYIPSDVVRRAREWLTFGSEASKFMRTDEGNGLRLVHYCHDQIRYCPDMKCWFLWDNGRYWRMDKAEYILQFASTTIRRIFEIEAHRATDSDEADALRKHAFLSQAIGRATAMVKWARSDTSIEIDSGALDADPYLINVANGTLNLRTGGLQRFRAEDFITRITNVPYDPSSRDYAWEQFLLRSCSGDQELLRYLQMAVGMSMTGVNPEHKMFVVYGPPATGKSTLIGAVERALGPYCVHAQVNTFLRTRDDESRAPRQDLARLKGAHLVTCSEMRQGQKLSEDIIKQITGQDTITARFLYGNEFQFTPGFTIWMGTNFRPIVQDSSGAIWRRMVSIPFSNEVPESERRTDLRDYLENDPGAQKAVLAWMVAGCRMWIENGQRLGEPAPVVQQSTQEYQAESDTVAIFIEQCCVLGPDQRTGSNALYESYRSWCRRNGQEPIHRNYFRGQLEQQGLQSRRATSGIQIIGIGLNGTIEMVDPFEPITPGRN